jgi:hypothetical protein
MQGISACGRPGKRNFPSDLVRCHSYSHHYYQVFGVENPFKSEREEKFFTLQLEVKHKRNILESLDLFVEGEMLEGDNKYFCEEANQKVLKIDLSLGCMFRTKFQL